MVQMANSGWPLTLLLTLNGFQSIHCPRTPAHLDGLLIRSRWEASEFPGIEFLLAPAPRPVGAPCYKGCNPTQADQVPRTVLGRRGDHITLPGGGWSGAASGIARCRLNLQSHTA